MSKETAHTAEGKTYSASEQGFQRLLLREFKDQSQPGDGLKRAGLNLSILVGATVADIGESHLIDKVMREPLEKKVHEMRHTALTYDQAAFERDLADEQVKQKLAETLIGQQDKLLDAAKTMQGKAFAADFVEEWATDGIYGGLANGWVRMMTGMDDAKYVSETSAFLSEWGNVISQVFMGDKLWGKTVVNGQKVEPVRGKFGIKLAYKSMDLINPVNVEAAFRVIEEVPILGNGFAWLHEKSDELLETAYTRIGSTAIGKAVMGFHIGKNIKPV